MKKLTALALALLLLAATFSGCADNNKGNVDDDQDVIVDNKDNESENESESDENGADEEDEENKENAEDNKDTDAKDDEKENADIADGNEKADGNSDSIGNVTDTGDYDKAEPSNKSDVPASKPIETPSNDPKDDANTKPSVPVETPEVNTPAENEKPEEPAVPDVTPEEPSADKVDLSDKSLDEIFELIYEQHPIEIGVGSMEIDISDSNALKYETGLTDSSLIKEASRSGPIIGSIPMAMVLVRVNDSADAASVAQSMKDGINMRKWICVEADSLVVGTYGDVVMLFMVNEGEYSDVATVAEMLEAFKTVCGGSLDTEL